LVSSSFGRPSLHLGSRLGLCLFGISQSVHHAYASIRDRNASNTTSVTKNLSTAPSCWKVADPHLVLELIHTTLDLEDCINYHFFRTVRFLGC
jgi:hypothetical protein